MSTTQQNMLLTKFERYHRNNPHVYDLFKRYAFAIIQRGIRRTSVWLIMNRIRWEMTVETYGDEFKICNDYFALYARMFVVENPDYRDLFQLKTMKAGNEPAEDWLQNLLRGPVTIQ
jgi:hypothetical protein